MRDMAEVEKMMAKLQESKAGDVVKVKPTKLVRKQDGSYTIKRAVPKTCTCCCLGHCKFSYHKVGGALVGIKIADRLTKFETSFPHIYEKDFFDDDYNEVESIKSNLLVSERDGFFDTLTALETDFNLEEEVGVLDENNLA